VKRLKHAQGACYSSVRGILEVDESVERERGGGGSQVARLIRPTPAFPLPRSTLRTAHELMGKF
jgi:hypothetical protein